MEDNGSLAENMLHGGGGQGFFAVASGKISVASVVASSVLQDAVARCLIVVVDDTALRLEWCDETPRMSKIICGRSSLMKRRSVAAARRRQTSGCSAR